MRTLALLLLLSTAVPAAAGPPPPTSALDHTVRKFASVSATSTIMHSLADPRVSEPTKRSLRIVLLGRSAPKANYQELDGQISSYFRQDGHQLSAEDATQLLNSHPGVPKRAELGQRWLRSESSRLSLNEIKQVADEVYRPMMPGISVQPHLEPYLRTADLALHQHVPYGTALSIRTGGPAREPNQSFTYPYKAGNDFNNRTVKNAYDTAAAQHDALLLEVTKGRGYLVTDLLSMVWSNAGGNTLSHGGKATW